MIGRFDILCDFILKNEERHDRERKKKRSRARARARERERERERERKREDERKRKKEKLASYANERNISQRCVLATFGTGGTAN